MPDSANMSVLDGSTNAVTIEGYVQVDSGANLELIGTIHNQGTIDVDLEGPLPTDLIIDGAVTLDGGGTVTLDGSGDDIVGASSGGTLYNDDGTISGAGQIGNSGNFEATSLTLFNESSGVIDATGGTLTLDTGNTVTNHGLLEATSGGTLDVQDGAIDNTGTGANGIVVDGTSELLVDSTGLQLSGGGDVSLSGGQITENADNPLLTGSGTIVPLDLDNVDNIISGAGAIGSDDGKLALTNGGTIDANISGETLTVDTGNAMTNTGTLEATNGGTLLIDDAVNNSGAGNALIEGGTLEYSGYSNVNTTFDGSGTLVLAGTNSTPHFTGTLSDVGNGDVIDLTGIQYEAGASGTTLSYDTDTDVLTVADQGGPSFSIQLSGAYAYTQGDFTLTQDSGTGTDVVFSPQNLVVNSDFDSGPWLPPETLSGWSYSGNTGHTGIENGIGLNGGYAIYIGPIGSDFDLDQNIATVPGQTYQVQFYLENLGETPNDFTASFGGTTLLSLVNTEIDQGGYTEYTYDVTATSSSSELLFEARQDPTYWYLDDVSVVDVSGLAVTGAGSATIESGATLELGASDSQTITFATDSGTLKLDSPSTFTGQISGFTGTAPDAAHSDVIDLVGFDWQDTSVSASSAGGLTTLTVTDSSGDGLSATLKLVGTYSTPEFVVKSDGSDGADIYDPPAAANGQGSGSSGWHFAHGNDQINFASDRQNAASNQPMPVSIGGPGNDNFIFHPSLGADTGNANSPDDATELERFTSAQVQHWSPLISNAAHDAIDFVHHSDGVTPADLNAAHWHLAVQSAVHLH
jgi:hypothetical protein